MKKILILGLVVFICSAFKSVYALDWKDLHEKADKKTLEEALTAAKVNPGFVDAQYVLGLVYLNMHKDKEAQEVFTKIIASDNKIIEAKWGLAEILRRQHKLKESEEILNGLIKSHPEFSPAYISLAYIKYIQMDFEKSVQLAHKVIDQGADNVDLSNYVRSYAMMAGAKGMIAHYGGPLSKAINGTAVMPNLRRAERLQPDSPGVLFGLGSFYLLAPRFAGGNVDKAGPYLEKAIKIDANFSDAYVRLAQFYKLKRDNEKYQAYLNKALAIDPQSELALDIKNGNCKFICINAQE
jgi:tetratricopeptide (TPR) repeat protein